MKEIKSLEDFDTLKFHEPFEFKCAKCGKTHVINQYRKERISRYSTFLCEDCYREKQSLDKYGCINPMRSKEIRNKIEKTNIEKYGFKCPLQNEEIQEKTKETINSKYGCDNYVTSNEFKEKSRNTKFEKYGDSSYTNSEKRIETMNSKYGYDNPMQVKDFQNKAILTKRTLYGENLEKIVEKANATKIKNHGSISYNNREKAIETCIDRYGVEHYSMTKEYKKGQSSRASNHPEWMYAAMESNRNNHGGILSSQTDEYKIHMRNLRRSNGYLFQSKKYIYCGISFDCFEEMCVYIYCVYNGIPVIRNYSYHYYTYKDMDGNDHDAFPDFIINGVDVEIKDDRFIDIDNTWKVPSKNASFRDNDLIDRKRKCLESNNVIIIKNSDPWVVSCVDFVKSLFNIDLFHKSNYNNLCYGYTPFNLDYSKEYQDPIGFGKTPFNIGEINENYCK